MRKKYEIEIEIIWNHKNSITSILSKNGSFLEFSSCTSLSLETGLRSRENIPSTSRISIQPHNSTKIVFKNINHSVLTVKCRFIGPNLNES